MMQTKARRQTMTITLSPEVRKALQERAKQTRRTQVALIEWGLELVFEKLDGFATFGKVPNGCIN